MTARVEVCDGVRVTTQGSLRIDASLWASCQALDGSYRVLLIDSVLVLERTRRWRLLLIAPGKLDFGPKVDPRPVTTR